MGLTQALLHCGMKTVARTLVADIFVGPVDRLERLPAESCIFVANHTWRLDVITTTLVTRFMRRRYAVLASQRVASALRFVKHQLGLVPVSGSPLQNIGALKSVVASDPNTSVWIFPQAIWIPTTWDVRHSVPAVADRVIKLLNRGTPVVPVHIEFITVRQIRPAVVVTLGEVVAPQALSDGVLSDLMAEVRADAKARLAASCAEYRSILHGDGALFCGYPIRKRMIARYGRRVFDAKEFSLIASTNGWEARIVQQNPVTESQLRHTLAKALPGVLATSFEPHVRFLRG